MLVVAIATLGSPDTQVVGQVKGELARGVLAASTWDFNVLALAALVVTFDTFLHLNFRAAVRVAAVACVQGDAAVVGAVLGLKSQPA